MGPQRYFLGKLRHGRNIWTENGRYSDSFGKVMSCHKWHHNNILWENLVINATYTQQYGWKQPIFGLVGNVILANKAIKAGYSADKTIEVLRVGASRANTLMLCASPLWPPPKKYSWILLPTSSSLYFLEMGIAHSHLFVSNQTNNTSVGYLFRLPSLAQQILKL